MLRALAKQEGSIQKWIDAFWAAPKQKDEDVHDLMNLAMCATYDPDASAPYGVRLPVTMDTCEVIPERWQNFVAWDPLTLVGAHGDGLKSSRRSTSIAATSISSTWSTARGALHKRLSAMGVAHVYEEFADNHTSVDYRMDVSLPILARALTASSET